MLIFSQFLHNVMVPTEVKVGSVVRSILMQTSTKTAVNKPTMSGWLTMEPNVELSKQGLKTLRGVCMFMYIHGKHTSFLFLAFSSLVHQGRSFVVVI